MNSINIADSARRSAYYVMSDEKESPGQVEESPEGAGVALPMQMQLLSTWEVRKVPANCVSRLCTLIVTRLEIVRSIDPGLHSIVLAVSMKTPHRFLRSNEIQLPPSGLLDIPLQLTFSLQYPHFLKRGGNVLQIRLQRRKRYRNRPIGGYKTLVVGKVDMSQVLQHSFQGVVKLHSEKLPEHMAAVTVGSLTSTAVDMESRSHLAEGSSDEDEDDIFSDDMGERGSDSESGDNIEQPSFVLSRKIKKNRLKPSSAVLRLLRLNRPSKGGPVELVTALEDLQEGDRESAVTFASSLSDSEEEEELGGATPPRPTLSPFFGSDRCSMVSLPTSVRGAEHYAVEGTPHTLSKRYGSLEQAIAVERMEGPAFVLGSDPSVLECDLGKGRVWVVDMGSPFARVSKDL